jgi:hypothetical protein
MTNQTSEGSAVPPCPVCGREDECNHYVMGLDLTFMEARGALADAFLSAFARMMDLAPEADELEAFRGLTDQVRGWAQAENAYIEEGGPGMTSVVVDLFANCDDGFRRVKNLLNAVAAGD